MLCGFNFFTVKRFE